MKKKLTIILFIFCLSFTVFCNSNPGSYDKNNNNNSNDEAVLINSNNNDTFEKHGLLPQQRIIKNNFEELFPGYTFENITDLYLVKLSNNLHQSENLLVQMFCLDRIKKSIFYTLDFKSINEYTPSVLSNPACIAVSKNGDILIADTGNKTIYKFAFNGTTIEYKGIFLSDITAIDIAIDVMSNVYILESKTNTLRKYNINGEVINSFTSLLTGNVTNSIYYTKDNNNKNTYRINDVKSMSLDESGDIYIVYNKGKKIIALNSNGSFKKIFYLRNNITAESITVTNNSIYVISKQLKSILIISKNDLSYVGEYKTTLYENSSYEFENIHAIHSYPSTGLVVILDNKGGCFFIEASMRSIYQ